jgi:hypothetical protein
MFSVRAEQSVLATNSNVIVPPIDSSPQQRARYDFLLYPAEIILWSVDCLISVWYSVQGKGRPIGGVDI